MEGEGEVKEVGRSVGETKRGNHIQLGPTNVSVCTGLNAGSAKMRAASEIVRGSGCDMRVPSI